MYININTCIYVDICFVCMKQTPFFTLLLLFADGDNPKRYAMTCLMRISLGIKMNNNLKTT